MPVAYTNVGDQEEHEIQVYVDIPGKKILMELDGVLTDEWLYTSEEQLQQEMRKISFDELVQPGIIAGISLQQDGFHGGRTGYGM